MNNFIICFNNKKIVISTATHNCCFKLINFVINLYVVSKYTGITNIRYILPTASGFILILRLMSDKRKRDSHKHNPNIKEAPRRVEALVTRQRSSTFITEVLRQMRKR